MSLQTEVPLVPLPRLLHLRGALPRPAPSRLRRMHDRLIHDRVRLDLDALRLQMQAYRHEYHAT